MNQLIKIISLLTFFFLIIMMTLFRSYSLPGSTYRPVVRGTQWAISTRHSLATQAGVQIFQQGGNAIDATIAALAALGVVEPAMSGIGGEIFFLVYDPEAPSHVRCINGGGIAPSTATSEWYKNHGYSLMPHLGIIAGVVPGAIDAWIVTLDKYGTKSLGQVLAPAIYLAERGFPASEGFCANIKDAASELRKFESSRKLYFKQDGSFFKPGEIFKNPDLARTMQRLVEAEDALKEQGRSHGLLAARDEFYKTAMSRDFIEYSESHDGIFKSPDFTEYHALVEEPAHTNYRGYEVYKPASNNQGPSELIALNIIEGFPVASYEYYAASMVHHLAEAVNLAMADRERYMGDLQFAKTPLNGLLNKKYAEERRKLIFPDRRLEEYLPGNPQPYEEPPYRYAPQIYNFSGLLEDVPFNPGRNPSGTFGLLNNEKNSRPDFYDQEYNRRMDHTSYVCAADARGNVVSATPSLFQGFGSKEVVGKLGFPLNNRASYFHLEPEHANSLMPGKRPRNTITPSMALKDGKPFLTYGTPGGDQQCQALMQVLVNIVDYNKNVQEALDAPMFQSLSFPTSFSPFSIEPGVIELDGRTQTSVAEQLRVMGWDVRIVPEFSNNNGCAILIDPNMGAFAAGVISSKENDAAAW